MPKNREGSIVSKIFNNPYVTFLLGAGLTFLAILYPLYLIAIIIIIAMVLYAFRDKIDSGSFFKKSIYEKPSKSVKKTVGCPVCGSLTKHYKSCSHYGETKKK